MSHNSPSVTDGPIRDRSEPLRATYDWTAVSPSVAVADAVAEFTGREASSLDPLYDSVDTDALDLLVGRDQSDTVRISFPFGGCRVTVRSDGVVMVERAD